MKNISNMLIVGFVWILILTIGITYATIFLPALMGYNMPIFIIISLLFAIVFILLVISYSKSTCTNPGNPSQSLIFQYQQHGNIQQLQSKSKQRQQRKKQLRKNRRNKRSQQLLEQQELSNLKQIDYCFKCQNIKPLRSHHCKQCNQCILRMDHHCPWVGTCVGLLNHKYFILFLFYATTGLLIVALSIIIDFFSNQPILSKIDQNLKYVMYIVCVASILLALSIGFLFMTQIIASMENLTTLDTFIRGIQNNNPWDTDSIYDNLAQIFGKGGLWILPTKPNLQDFNDDINQNFQ